MADRSPQGEPATGVGSALAPLGSICVVGAIVGGGVQAVGTTLPLVNSLPRQLFLGFFGLLLLALGLWLVTRSRGGSQGESPKETPLLPQLGLAESPPSQAAALPRDPIPVLVIDRMASFINEPQEVTANIIKMRSRVERGLEPLFQLQLKDAETQDARQAVLEALGSNRSAKDSEELLWHLRSRNQWLSQSERFTLSLRMV